MPSHLTRIFLGRILWGNEPLRNPPIPIAFCPEFPRINRGPGAIKVSCILPPEQSVLILRADFPRRERECLRGRSSFSDSGGFPFCFCTRNKGEGTWHRCRIPIHQPLRWGKPGVDEISREQQVTHQPPQYASWRAAKGLPHRRRLACQTCIPPKCLLDANTASDSLRQPTYPMRSMAGAEVLPNLTCLHPLHLSSPLTDLSISHSHRIEASSSHFVSIPSPLCVYQTPIARSATSV